MIKIHIIEDNKEFAEEVSTFLKESGYNVVYSVNIKEARKTMTVDPCDFLILDVGLPDGTGFDFCKEVRSKSSIPILMLTAFDGEEDVIRGLKCGADDYVTKPCSLRVLSTRIQVLLRRDNWEKEDFGSLLSGDLRIDPLHRTIFNDTQMLNLGKTEIDIALVLIRENGRIIPRDVLLDRIWDSKDIFVEDNTLSVHVSRLRNKLGRFNGVSYIETVKGIGYRWNVEVKKSSLLK